MANSQGEGNAFATPRSSAWIVLNCILFVIVLDSCCWWLDKGLPRVFKGQTVFEFRVFRFRGLGASFSSFGCFVFETWVVRFRVLGASFSRFGCSVFESWVLCFRDLGGPFSSFGCFVFEIWVLRFRVLGASFSRFGCFVLRSSLSSVSFSKLPFSKLFQWSNNWYLVMDYNSKVCGLLNVVLQVWKAAYFF